MVATGALVDRSEGQTGIEVTDLRFNRALAAYKMAALGEQGVAIIEGEQPL
ncbi:hypothetical protein [Haloglomus litoreum]|uniref:hypothetical protein n=1 Tax=Haloglomus litoreum TaxID=3034026 RepID=UPI0023E76060|nr:hypothetical protein [Haloglomus sp. DT116]